jgi:hypothetical protein
VQTPTKFLLGFAVAGFGIGAALCRYTVYLTSHGRIGNMALFLILCPPSIGAMALDNAGKIGGLIGWLIISIENAFLYGLIGVLIGAKMISRPKL